MAGFIGGNELQINTHCLRQFDQERQKMTVMMICRSQEGDKGKALT